MIYKNNICLIAGDIRQYYLACIFFSHNYQIHTYDLSLVPPAAYSSFNTIPLSSVCHTHTALADAIKNSQVIILPYKVDNVLADELSSQINLLKNKYLFGGNIPSSLDCLLRSNSITYYNYFKPNHIARANAIATAEGTILELIKRSPYNLHNSHILITGYGNCAQVLANKLIGLNTHVTICCRNYFSGTCALSNGLNYIPLSDLENVINNYQYIINTIPTTIISNKLLSQLNKNIVILDIASSPGGFDLDYASSLNLNATSLPGIPGKISPYSSASILYNYISEVLSEHLYINT
jgi:dipicolinate synthase subunit A